jgi:hypothetical protein
MRHRPSARFLRFALLLVALLSLFPLYSNYKQAAAPIPPGVLLAGVDVTGLKTVAEIRAHMDPIYHELIGVRYQNSLFMLDPDDFAFRVDFDQMVADAGRYLEGWDFVDIAVREAIGLPQQVRAVPARYTVDEARLRAWLEERAAQLNTSPVAARVVESVPATPPPNFPATVPRPRNGLVWEPGRPGYAIDVEASLQQILAGLTSHDAREVTLVARQLPPPVPQMSDLTPELLRLLNEYPAFTAVSVFDLQQEQRASVDGDAAFSAMATLRIALAVAVLEKLPGGVAREDPEAMQVGSWLDLALGKDADEAANLALAWLGDGSTATGAERLTAFLRTLGLENSFIQGAFGGTAQSPQVTPSNQRERPNTRPDANMQTTADDMATLLAALYRCSQGGGLLLERFPETLNAEKCATLLFYMTHNPLRSAVWRGLPEWDARWIVHRHGLSFAQQGEVALIWGPTGPYVLSVFVYNPGLVGWEVANQAVADLSRVVWEFFAFQRAQGGAAAAPPLELSPPPGYTPAASPYPPSAANPTGR